MSERTTYRRELDVEPAVDVLVVGGGPAGIAAAVASARNGARTMLLERYGFLGGNLTAGLVGPCMTSYSLDGETQLIRGVFEEFVERMVQAGGALHPSGIPAGSAYSGFITYGHDKVTPFEPEAAKLCAVELCADAGVEVLLHTLVVDTIVEDGAVRGVICAGKSGMHVQPASVVVDCSADGDVAARSGAPFEVGRDEDGLTQPMTLFFRVADVDDAVVETYVQEHSEDVRPFASIVTEGRRTGEFPSPRRGVGMYRTLEPGVWRINTTRVLGRDGTETRDLTHAEIDGRRQVHDLVEFFRSRLPGFERCRLLDTASQIGVRETRRILGEYLLTLDDLQSGREFDDVIGLCGYPVDIHSPTSDGGGVSEDLATANIYQIPYRSLVPREIDQLLVAGRCVSATHEALAAIRVMPPAFAMGQAAGTAAAIAVRQGCSPRRVPVGELQNLLVSQGAEIGGPVDQPLATAAPDQGGDG
jgi:hypothetical protein